MRYIFFTLVVLELLSLIQLGVILGPLAAISHSFVTILLGIFLIRKQGQSLLRKLSVASEIPRPFSQMSGKFRLVMSGFFLILPGLFSDTIAIALILYDVSKRLQYKHPEQRAESDYFNREEVGDTDSAVIEGSYKRIDD